jgi:hypothetical protein
MDDVQIARGDRQEKVEKPGDAEEVVTAGPIAGPADKTRFERRLPLIHAFGE